MFRRTLLAVSLVSALAYAPATHADSRSVQDVYVLDVLAVRADARPHEVDTYLGALALVARRHGGTRLTRIGVVRDADGSLAKTVVGVWRFANPRGPSEVLADPEFARLAPLRDRTFDGDRSHVLGQPAASLALSR